MKRVIYIIAIVVVAIIGTAHRAEAITEVCPAWAQRLDPLDAATGSKTAATYAYELTSFTPETVSGTLSIQTDSGWYDVAFGPTALAAHKGHYQYGNIAFDRSDVYSNPLYVRFAAPTGIKRVFVSSITTDDSVFPWVAKSLTCEFTSVEPKNKSDDKPYVEEMSPWIEPEHPGLKALPAGAVVVRPVKTAEFDALPCAEPFKGSRADGVVGVTQPALASVIQATRQVVEAWVAIDDRGKVIDAWIWAPGSAAVNRETLRGARLSWYVPAISRCKPVAGIYIYRADFDATGH